MAKGVAVLTAGIVALLAPAVARAYPWPIKPFDEPHAIRGAFGDPRSGRSFHFGVDISAPDGTPVYAVAPGTAFRYQDAVDVRQPDGREFSFWHIDAAVGEHSFVNAGDLLGWVKAPWEHVHFAEFDGTTYVNPLRPGGLEPYADTTTPVIQSVDVDGSNATVEAYDPPPIAPPFPWQDARWTPERIRWRLDGGDWSTAYDFTQLYPPSAFDSVYAPGTEQNKPEQPGRYVFWLFRGLDLAPGRHTLEVEASDTGGNTATASKSFTTTGVAPRRSRVLDRSPSRRPSTAG
ncbi:MAG TPA: peptidoglycan DD-metalloendopeptidase family protein [Gaiellaceae bacterium]|nr:peptidoglycan DD-metalloendopeptidase family protein [Gaiellaceae bacterium]